MGRRSGLGRGLGALIPPAEVPSSVPSAAADEVREVAVDDIVPNRYQPRAAFDEDGLRELASSIDALGVLQPLLVQRRHGPDGQEQFELIAGERRWRAARVAGLTHVPVIVRSVEAQQSLEQALVENLQREDLNPVEEALAYRQLVDEFSLSHDEIATRVGRSRSAVTNTLRLLNLGPEALELVTSGALGAGHGRALLGIDHPEQQASLARRAAAEGWSVRRVEDEVKLRLARAVAPEPAAHDDVPSPGDRAAALLELEGLLSDHLSTRVSVQLGRGRGKVLIEFADIEDLERIYQAIVGRPDDA
jgi:ParB family chromosome partitioning protein